MKVTVQAPNFAADEKLIMFIERKLNKLEQFYDRIIFADVFLKVQKTREKENKSVEILLTVPGGDLIVKKEARTFEAGTDECMQSLERQLKKRKEKLRAKAS
ncbi:MAG: ribosome-associated translation inhibitor RaiA [Bacteroidia bacterium]|nr:ribosome-associated translation inhibitor RaiA [Bacteroidia bacterium]NNF32253.1 ribosome-associated translation inhibitor RaiA [Flavobacteriaceae bacterium]MBT8276895.1 ribosome-associated translation inhibitor RaiA [Bacteroidia bacterium]NNJ82913.1 ribosome-associated translation inhibitor RaiA [Flavobacteriaceae bacterium]NNK53788.1 ribosome-associated translation inhibitor RaiA [Flavobacteriaceae bacterium]